MGQASCRANEWTRCSDTETFKLCYIFAKRHRCQKTCFSCKKYTHAHRNLCTKRSCWKVVCWRKKLWPLCFHIDNFVLLSAQWRHKVGLALVLQCAAIWSEVATYKKTLPCLLYTALHYAIGAGERSNRAQYMIYSDAWSLWCQTIGECQNVSLRK